MCLQKKRAEDGEILSESGSDAEGGGAPKKKRARKERKKKKRRNKGGGSSDSEPEYDSDGNMIMKKKR